MTDGSPIGRIGDLPCAMDIEDFAKRVKEILGAPFVNLARAGDVASRVAFVGGGGGSFITNARDAVADTFVSGDIGYHALTDAPDFKCAPLNLIEVGHFYSEHPVCEVLKSMVLSIAPDVTCDIYFSNVIKAI
jgi:putative NIF3 family GTP cyclohydrolase 1 type 2